MRTLALTILLLLSSACAADAARVAMYGFESGGVNGSLLLDYDGTNNDGIDRNLGGTFDGIFCEAPNPVGCPGDPGNTISYVSTNTYAGLCEPGYSDSRTKCTAEVDCTGKCVNMSATNTYYLNTFANSSKGWFKTEAVNSTTASFVEFIHVEDIDATVGNTIDVFEATFSDTGATARDTAIVGSMSRDAGTGLATLKITFPQDPDGKFFCSGSYDANQGASCTPCSSDTDCAVGHTCSQPGDRGACTNECPSESLNESSCLAESGYAVQLGETTPANSKWAAIGWTYEKDPDGDKEIELRVYVDGQQRWTKKVPRGQCDTTCPNAGAGCANNTNNEVCGVCTGGGGCSLTSTIADWPGTVDDVKWGAFNAVNVNAAWKLNFDDVRVDDAVDTTMMYSFIQDRYATGQAAGYNTHNATSGEANSWQDVNDDVGDLATYYRIQSNHHPPDNAPDLVQFDMTTVTTSADSFISGTGGVKVSMQGKDKGNKSAGQGKTFRICLGADGVYETACSGNEDLGAVDQADVHWVQTFVFPGAGAAMTLPWTQARLETLANPSTMPGNPGTTGTLCYPDGGGSTCQFEITNVMQEYDIALTPTVIPFDTIDQNGDDETTLLVIGDSTLNSGVDDNLENWMPGWANIYACTQGGALMRTAMLKIEDLLDGDITALKAAGILDCEVMRGASGKAPDYVWSSMGINDIAFSHGDREKYCFDSGTASDNGRCCSGLAGSVCLASVGAENCVANGGHCEYVAGLCRAGANHGLPCQPTPFGEISGGVATNPEPLCMVRDHAGFGLPRSDALAAGCGFCTVDTECKTNVACSTTADCRDTYGPSSILFGTCHADGYCQGECGLGGQCQSAITSLGQNTALDNQFLHLDHPLEVGPLRASNYPFNPPGCPQGQCIGADKGQSIKWYNQQISERSAANFAAHPTCPGTGCATGCLTTHDCPFKFIHYAIPKTTDEAGAGSTRNSAYEQVQFQSDHLAATVVSMAEKDTAACFVDANNVFRTDPAKFYVDYVHPDTGLGVAKIGELISSCFNSGTIDGVCGGGNTCTTGGNEDAHDGDACVTNADCSTVYCPCVLE